MKVFPLLTTNNQKYLNFLFVISIIAFLTSKVYWIESTEWSYLISQEIELSEYNYFYHRALATYSGLNLIKIFFF